MGETPVSQPLHEALETGFRSAVSRRWRWHTVEGSGLILLGVASLLTAAAADSMVTGAILLAAGSLTLLPPVLADQCPSFGLSLLLAIIAFAAGLHLLGDPPKTTLGLAFAAYFSLRGSAATLLAAKLRRQNFREWEWTAVSSATSLILAGLILSGLPGPYVWMLGLLLGVGLIFDGSALLALVLASGTASSAASAPAMDEPLVMALPGGAFARTDFVSKPTAPAVQGAKGEWRRP